MRSIKDIDLGKITTGRQYMSSPENWEDELLYFLLVDRFSNGKENPDNLYIEADRGNAFLDDERKNAYLHMADRYNGGTIKGITSKLDYLKGMGISAIWLSPIFRQVAFEESYHGYGIQNFLELNGRFGTKDDLRELVDKAHSMGMYVILDIIINHTGNVFTYENGYPKWTGETYNIRAFNDRNGNPVDSPEYPLDAVWPIELQNEAAFTRKGEIVNWDNDPEYREGDFFSLKDINLGSGDYRDYVPSEALKVITTAFKYWIADFDVDGFRLDTVKHVDLGATRYFATEIHEFTQKIGKKNFALIGEITGGLDFAMDVLEKTGLDSALGINAIPNALEDAAKGYIEPDAFFDIFRNSELEGSEDRKWTKGKVVTMFDDHDMVSLGGGNKFRFAADKNTRELLSNAIFLNVFTLGIPCIYYGSEQALDGNGDSDKYIRECMFESDFGAFGTYGKNFFSTDSRIYTEMSSYTALRREKIALTQGRLYPRELSYDGEIITRPVKMGDARYEGVIAWSRILSDEEYVLAINTDLVNDREVYIEVDGTMTKEGDAFEALYSSTGENHVMEAVVISGRTFIKATVPAAGNIILGKR